MLHSSSPPLRLAVAGLGPSVAESRRMRERQAWAVDDYARTQADTIEGVA